MNTMNILYTATVLSHICQFHLPHMKALQEMGWEVHVAAHDNLAVKNGLRLRYCDKFTEIPFERSPKSPKNVAAYRQLKKLIEEEKYDVILCNTPVGGVVTRLAAKKARKNGTKVIYMAHGFHFYKGASKSGWLVYYPLEKAMARRCDVLVTVNEEDYRLACERFGKRTRVARIHGVGVDEGRYHPVTAEERGAMRAAEGLSESDFAILCTGELNENKNQTTLIAAAAQLKNELPNLRVLLAGNGPKEQELRAQIAALGLEGNVKLLGYRTDLERVTPAVDLVVSCSLREGMPLNIIEAMLCKKPVVASHNRGHDELVEEGVTGFLIDPKEAPCFAAAIRKLALDPNTRAAFGDRAFERAIPYSVGEVKKELGGLLLDTVEKQ